MKSGVKQSDCMENANIVEALNILMRTIITEGEWAHSSGTWKTVSVFVPDTINGRPNSLRMKRRAFSARGRYGKEVNLGKIGLLKNTE